MESTKSTLEQELRKRAEQQFQSLVQSTGKLIAENPILRKLWFKPSGEANPIALSGGGIFYLTQGTLYDKYVLNEQLLRHTNLADIREELIQRFEVEELQKLLSLLEDNSEQE